MAAISYLYGIDLVYLRSRIEDNINKLHRRREQDIVKTVNSEK